MELALEVRIGSHLIGRVTLSSSCTAGPLTLGSLRGKEPISHPITKSPASL